MRKQKKTKSIFQFLQILLAILILLKNSLKTSNVHFASGNALKWLMLIFHVSFVDLNYFFYLFILLPYFIHMIFYLFLHNLTTSSMFLIRAFVLAFLCVECSLTPLRSLLKCYSITECFPDHLYKIAPFYSPWIPFFHSVLFFVSL